MRFVSMSLADEAYQVASDCSIESFGVAEQGLQVFDERLLELKRSLAEDAADDYWRQGLSWLNRCRFNLMATPLPSSHSRLGGLTAVVLSREHFKHCDQVYPQAHAAVEGVLSALVDVVLQGSDALSIAIVEACADVAESGRVCVVLPTLGFESAVASHLRSVSGLRGLAVLRPAQIASKRSYDLLLIVGRSVWYRRGSWIFSTPRASRTVVVCHEWLLDRELPAAQVFTQSHIGVTAVRLRTETSASIVVDNFDDGGMEIDWELLAHQLPREASGDDLADVVVARLLLLVDGRAAFVGASDDSRVQILLPEEKSGGRIGWLPAGDVVPGSFVLLRSEGGGDLVAVVADRLLGEDAPKLRTMQANWKAGLARRVETEGIDVVVASLRARGVARASRGNLANWMSPRSLRTADETDFVAIMDLVGLRGEARMYWNAMGVLHEAHQRAGHEIRRQLEDVVERTDLDELDTNGLLDFTLEAGGGTLTAFRVEDVSPQTHEVPYQRLGEPFRPRL